MGAIKLENYSETDIRNAELGRAIGAPARITILRMIYQNSSVSGPELLNNLDLDKTTVYQHIDMLVFSGLIIGSFLGNKYRWQLNPETTEDFEKIKWALN